MNDKCLASFVFLSCYSLRNNEEKREADVIRGRFFSFIVALFPWSLYGSTGIFQLLHVYIYKYTIGLFLGNWSFRDTLFVR